MTVFRTRIHLLPMTMAGMLLSSGVCSAGWVVDGRKGEVVATSAAQVIQPDAVAGLVISNSQAVVWRAVPQLMHSNAEVTVVSTNVTDAVLMGALVITNCYAGYDGPRGVFYGPYLANGVVPSVLLAPNGWGDNGYWYTNGNPGQTILIYTPSNVRINYGVGDGHGNAWIYRDWGSTHVLLPRTVWAEGGTGHGGADIQWTPESPFFVGGVTNITTNLVVVSVPYTGLVVTAEALAFLPAHPVLKFDLGDGYTDFVLKSSTNNFASFDYVVSSSTVIPAPTGDPGVGVWYQDDYADDPRKWIKAENGVPIGSVLIDPGSMVSTVVVAPSRTFDCDDPRRVWVYARMTLSGFETNATGRANAWNQAARWRQVLPDWRRKVFTP